MPVTLPTLMLVAPAAAPAARVVLRPGVPTLVTVTDSAVPPVLIRMTSPAAIPVVDATFTLASPADAGENSVVLRDCVPMAATVAVSSSTLSVPPTTKFATLPTLMLVSPATAGTASAVSPYVQRNSRASLYADRSDTVVAP